jgi:hypothetical protein
MAKRAATQETVERPLDRVFWGSRLIFRGQKTRYTLAPSIRRESEEDRVFHKTAIHLLWTALNELLHKSPDQLLQRFWDSITLQEAACIAQHYKLNKGPQTFLLDWSFDPFIAVHFATRHAYRNEADEAAVYIMSFKQAASHQMAIVAPPLFAGRLYDQAGLFLDCEAASQDLDPQHVLKVRFPVDSCVELPKVANRPYDPLEPDPFWGSLIGRITGYAASLTEQQCRTLLSAPELQIAKIANEISKDMQLVAPWSAAVARLMSSADRLNEIKLIENMIVRFLDWVAFRARLDGAKSCYYYDPEPLKELALTSPSLFHVLAKTSKVLLSLGRQTDQRVILIMQALGYEL